MPNKRWVPYLLLLLLSLGMVFILTRKQPPKVPRFPVIRGLVHGIDSVTIFAFLPVADQRQVMLFVDFQKSEYGGMGGGFIIHFFNDFDNTPEKYPFSEGQVSHLCATYRYNQKDGVDQLSWRIPPEKPAADHY